jgi:hypothetical protein
MTAKPFYMSLMFLTAMHILIALAVANAITIATMAASTAWHTGIRSVLIIIIVVHYLIPIQWSSSQQVSRLLLPADWWVNLSHETISTVPREMLDGEFNNHRACCCQNGHLMHTAQSPY